MVNNMNKDELIDSFLLGEHVSQIGGDNTFTKTQINHLDDNYLNDFRPLEVKVYNGGFDRAFKQFRMAVQKDRILSLFKEKSSYEKPSEKRRRKRNEMNQKRMELEAKQAKIISGEFEKELLKKQKMKDLKKQLRDNRSNNKTE